MLACRPKSPRAVVTQTEESMPENGTHWSCRLMARKTGLSQTAVMRIWHAFSLQPHRVENFKFSEDPQFVGKVRDIVGLSMNPPGHAIALRVDEKSQVQALNRHGVTSLSAALNMAAGADLILGGVERLCKRIADSGPWRLLSSRRHTSAILNSCAWDSHSST